VALFDAFEDIWRPHGSHRGTSWSVTVRNQGAAARHVSDQTAGEWRPRRRHDAAGTPAGLAGSCAGFYAAQYLRKHKLASEGTRVRVTADKRKDPARLDNFHIEIEAPAALTEQHRAGVENSVHHCLIHNTLLQPPSIVVEIAGSTPAANESAIPSIPGS